MNSKVLSLDEWNDIDLPAFGLTFGNFDGVHLGHVHLIAQFVKSCRERSIAPVAFTFVPHPEVYFSPERDHLISSYEYRRKRLFTLGIERLVECDFEKVRCLSGEEFAQLYLLTKPNLRLIWIGHDFTFGKNRVEPQSSMFSNVEVIKNLPVTKENKIISSSLIGNLSD